MLLPINQDEKAVLETALEIYIGEMEVLNNTKVSYFLKLKFQDSLDDAKRLLEELRKVGKPSVFEMDKQVRDFLKCEYKIQAIKYVREVTGKGLKEAKDYVDVIHDQMKEEKRIAEEAAKAPAVVDWDRDTGNGFNERGYAAGQGTYHDPMG